MNFWMLFVNIHLLLALFSLLFYVAQILRPLCSSDPESDPEQEKSRRSGTHVTSGIWQISEQRGRKAPKINELNRR